MKIEFILIGVIALVFLVDFFYKKNRRKIETKDITVYKTRKVRSRIKYFAILGIILIGAIGYFIVYPYLIFMEAEESKKTGSFLKAAELYDKTKSISPVFVKNDSLKFVSIALFAESVLNNKNDNNQERISNLEFAIEKIFFLRSQDSVYHFINQKELYINQLKLFIEKNLLKNGKNKGMPYDFYFSRRKQSEEDGWILGLVRQLEELNKNNPDSSIDEFLGKYLNYRDSYDKFLDQKKNIKALDYIEALSIAFFQKLNNAQTGDYGNRPQGRVGNIYILKWFSELNKLSYDSSDPFIILIKAFINKMDIYKPDEEKVGLESQKNNMEMVLNYNEPKNLREYLTFLEMSNLLFSNHNPYELYSLKYIEKSLDILEKLKYSKFKNELEEIYGKKEWDIFYYENYTFFNFKKATIKENFKLNKQVIEDMEKTISFLLKNIHENDTHHYANISDFYDFIRRAKWNIKPFGKKLGYCNDLESALNYSIKAGLEIRTELLKEEFLSDCN